MEEHRQTRRSEQATTKRMLYNGYAGAGHEGRRKKIESLWTLPFKSMRGEEFARGLGRVSRRLWCRVQSLFVTGASLCGGRNAVLFLVALRFKLQAEGKEKNQCTIITIDTVRATLGCYGTG